MRRLAVLSAVALAATANLNDTLLWGAYRPGLYFGLRPRIPQSLMTGLMWFGTQDYQAFTEMRHACEQNDKMDTYTWTEYDPRQGGVEIVKDKRNNLDLRIEWLKVPGGDAGGSWAVRFKGKPLDEERPLRVSMIWYHGVEGLGGIEMDTAESDIGLLGDVLFSGSTPTLGDFDIRVVEAEDNKPIDNGRFKEDYTQYIGKTQFLGLPMGQRSLWQAKDAIIHNIYETAQKALAPYKDATTGPPDPAFVLRVTNDVHTDSTLYVLQKFYEGPFQFDVFYENNKQHIDDGALTQGIKAFTDDFDRRFAATFPTPSEYLQFSKAVTSNLLGGIGYFYGTSIVDNAFVHEWDDDGLNGEEDDDEDEDAAGKRKKSTGEPKITEPKALLTATPSRSFFPRGFYWDEGFHLLHIGAWDNDLSLEILKDWIALINEDGWVAREQILGEEARSRVPQEFQTQYPTYANPPTLTMAVTAFIDRLNAATPSGDDVPLADLGMEGVGAQIPLEANSPPAPVTATPSIYLSSRTHAIAFLREIYPALRRHYDWFRKTQRGQLRQYGRKATSKTEAYRWRGRSETHILTSGMDDYPRAPPHAGELHLDLISWMGFFTRTMRSIAVFLEETDDEAEFAEIEKGILANIDDLHWDEERQLYCDVGINSDDESYHECNEGYLSLFPLLLGLLPPDSPHLGPILDLMSDPERLWSDYGLRSLSKSHALFGQGENYWRGPIWMPMNYMALRSLFKVYMVQAGPYQQRAREVYTQLRKNIVENEYERTGYVWEQYDSTTGNGQRSHPFTGWTSLVTLIISEKY
ncbi:glycoside hydrolase [Exidia glandulosa HHB12029]|uniref:Mannosyl-oligosaccharide glucosidase n=1 Tax=Exidia glandulosa HHB12029 TaxID=1314781 RepID=A0A165BJ44_EXIGL|nr:glycoside hydrolase [Exidia glandulosa HHB12029]